VACTRQILGLLFLAAALLVPATARAGDDTWDAAVNGYFHDDTKWTDGLAPTAADTVEFGVNTTPYEVWWDATTGNRTTQSMSLTDGDVTFRIENGAGPYTWTITNGTSDADVTIMWGALTLGTAGDTGTLTLDIDHSLVVRYGGTLSVALGNEVQSRQTSVGDLGASLTIEDGGQVRNITGQVTSFSGSAGTVTVTGPGSTWTNSGTLYVGHWGAGTLNIEDEGLVESAEGFLGYGSGSSGTVTVTGGGSTWTNSGGLSVGDVGAGTLTIEAGGLVSNTFSDLGHLSGSSGEATVTGADSMWTNSAGLSIGTFGDGRLTIEAGGHVVNTDGYLGRWSSGTGFATVTGADSTWGNSGSLSVGYNGDGALTVEAGGQVSNTAAGYLGRIAGSTGTATVTGVGSTWGNSGSFYVGYNGDGTLTVEAGGYVSSVWGLLGNGSGSSGTVTVTGAGSTWNSSDFIVGLEGIGTLTVEAGGQVTSDYGYLGFYSGSTGTVSVTGEGSTWETTNSLYLGGTDTDDGGDASVTVSDGGRLYVGDEAANYTLSSSVSAVVVSDGDTTGGALWVRNGALLTNDGRAYLGYGSGETGAVTVTGGGSTWENSTGLCVGYYGTGTLTVTDGGLVTAGTLYASPGDLLGNGTIETHGAILDTDLVFDSTHGLVQALAFGTGGTLNLNVDGTGGLGAGHQGTGTLRIADGLTVTSPFGVLGYRSGSTGTATVTGGSTWTNSGELYVGFKGDGDLTVEAGGAVSNSFGYVALYSGRTGAVTVTGFTEDPDRNSTWQCTGNLYLGGTDTDDGGDADVALMNGGRFYVGDQAAAAAAAFEVSDTVLVVSDGDTVGGELWVRNGAVLTNDGGAYLGYGAGETGTTKVTGAGSTLANPVELFVGHEGTGTLTVEDGGQVSNDYGVLGVCSGSTGAATVTGTGSTWTNSVTLRVGLDGVGTLTVTDGGRVTAGTLYASPSDLFGNGTIETHGAILDTGLVFDSTHGLVQTLPFGTGGTLALDVDGTGGLGAGHQGTGTLTIDDGLTVMSTIGMLGHRAGSTGTATVTGGSTWINSGALYVGSGGNGELTVEAGGHVVNTDGYLGQWPAGSGTATVTGGSTWTSSGDLYVGCYGAGTLAVEAGATVDNADGYLGYEPGSSGTATVTGSTWTSSGDLYVGYEGGGTLNIAGNGHVSSAWSVLGDGSGSSGTVKVTGGVSTWNAGILYVGGYDTGTLTVEDGGTVSSGMGFLGRESGANGTATVTGAGSTWADLLELYVGDEGDGTLNIEDGGEVSNTYGYLGYESGSTGTATVTGAGSTWADLYDLYVGVEGAGTLNIEAGGEVTSDGGRLGFYSGSTGTAKVTGGGSTWSISGNLYVGRGGTGTLTIEAGGQVSSHRGYLGYEPGSTGTVSVTGEGSTWETTDSLYLGGTAPGDGGQAEVTLSGGGRLYVGDKAATNTLFFSSGVSAVVASDDDTTGGEAGETGTATVRGAGSTWANQSMLFVGNLGTGTLGIRNGGSVSGGLGRVARYGGSTGTVTVEGEGSTWLSRLNLYLSGTESEDGGQAEVTLEAGGRLHVGDIEPLDVTVPSGVSAVVVSDGGATGSNLWLRHGAVLTNDGWAYLGYSSGETGTVTVIGGTWTNSSSLYVGRDGDGELTIAAGGLVSNTHGSLGGLPVVGSTSTGTATVTGSGSTWTNSCGLCVGVAGAGTLTIEAGGQVESDVGLLGATLDSRGMATVTGGGSTWTNSGGLCVGQEGAGTLTIEAGGAVSSADGQVAWFDTATGTVTLDGGAWTTTDYVSIGGSDYEAGGTGTVTVFPGGLLSVGTRLFLWPDGTLNLLGGTVRFHAADPVDDQGGTVDYVAGTVAFDCDVPIGAGMSQVTDFFGSPATIPAGKGLEVTGTATLWTPVTIDGGTLSVGSIVHGALLDFQSGTFNLTDDDLAIAPTGLFGDTVMLPTGKTINVTNTATVDSGAMLHLTGGHFSAGTLANDGLVRLDDPHSALGGGTLVNGGVLTGTGRVNARLDNQVAGEVRIGSGEEIVFTASGNTNAGEIKLLGGIAEFEGDLTNVSTGFISGRGVLDVAGGLTNLGVLAFSGGFTDLYGDVTNDAAAQIVISGGSVTTFYDDLASNGEIRVSAECSAVFFGAFTGTGGTTGSGTVYIEGDLRPGHSPAEVSFGGDMVFGPAAALEVELGGTAPAAYDAVHVAGTATLGGTLAVDLIDPYRPSHNDAFEVMTFASRGGTTFAAHEGLNLGDRLALVPTYGDTDLVLTAVQGGPGEWAVDGDGDASVPANWSAGLPNGVGDVATFGSVITAPREVTVDTPTTLGRLVFDSVEAYALAGPNPLTFETEAGAAAIDVADLAATHVIGADVVLADALEVDVAALGTLVFDGTLDNGSGLTLTKTGTGLLVIDGPQDHAPGADFEVLGGTVEMKSDASGTGFMDDADLSIFVADATLDFGCDQHLDTLEIGDDGLVRFTGANVVVVKNLVMNGIPLGPTTLTPEPATLGLLGAGLLGIAASRRRRTHA